MDKFETTITCKRASEISSDLIEQWRKLYLNSISPNIYLSPDFVLTALDTFCSEDPLVIGVNVNDRLSGLAILQENERSLAFPFRSMKLFKTIHSFQAGILLKQGMADEAIDAFLHGIFAHGASNIAFADFDMTTATAGRLIASAQRQKLHWYKSISYLRPTLESCIALDQWKTARKKMIKESDRRRRRLAEQGRLDWRILMPDEVTRETVETFLSLEHNGWKGDRGSSLLSRDQEAAFFRQLVPRLAGTGEIFFTELHLNDEAIASTVNFMSRRVAFAFKVGWDKSFARFAPGILNEISFVEYAASNELPFAYIESGVNGNSFIERLWPGRISMFTGYLIHGRIAKLTASAISAARQLKRVLQACSARR